MHRPLHNGFVPGQKEGGFLFLFLENVCVIDSLHISVYPVMTGPTSFSCGAGPPPPVFPRAAVRAHVSPFLLYRCAAPLWQKLGPYTFFEKTFISRVLFENHSLQRALPTGSKPKKAGSGWAQSPPAPRPPRRSPPPGWRRRPAAPFVGRRACAVSSCCKPPRLFCHRFVTFRIFPCRIFLSETVFFRRKWGLTSY